jgi:hypothetical protein
VITLIVALAPDRDRRHFLAKELASTNFQEVSMNSKGFGWMVVLSALSAGLSQNAAAENIQTTKAAVSLDWSHFQLSVTGQDGVVPNVEYTNALTTAATNRYVQESASNWTETIRANSVSADEQAHALASPLILSVNTEATADTDIDQNFVGTNATIFRRVDYTIDGTGTIAISVPYMLSISGSGCFHDCYSYQHAEIFAFTGFAFASPSADLNVRQHFVALHNDGSKSGNLTFSINAGHAGHGYISLAINAVSAVPEPEAYAMLLAGLGLLGFIARRRQRTS